MNKYDNLARRHFLQYGAALAATGLLAACRRSQRQASLAANSTVLALGDSLTAGYGAEQDAAYPAVLATLTGWQVINGGVSGDTSAQALARLPELMQQQPQLVLVSIGGNDFLRQLPESETHDHIRRIITSIQSAAVPLVLVGVPHFTTGALFGRLSDHPMYAELAKEFKIPLLAGVWADILGDKSLKSDQIHANAKGYRQFAQTMQRFLQKEGFAA